MSLAVEEISRNKNSKVFAVQSIQSIRVCIHRKTPWDGLGRFRVGLGWGGC